MALRSVRRYREAPVAVAPLLRASTGTVKGARVSFNESKAGG